MARCGCAGSGGCGCVVQATASSGLSVSGNGTPSSPYSLSLGFTTWSALTGTYVNGFSAYVGSTVDVPQYRTFAGGRLVQLRGRILNTSWVMNTNILTGIPFAIWPGKIKFMPVASGNASGDNGQISVTAAGVLVNQSTQPTDWISLDGIIYESASDV